MSSIRRRTLGGKKQYSGNRIARVLFCMTEGKLVLLHGFIKKTEKSPEKELSLARSKKKEI